MFDRIKTRLGSEEGFTLIELLVVIIILGILVAIAVPSYLSLRGNAQETAAEANVRSATPAAETYYQEQDPASYSGMSLSTLSADAPGLAPSLKIYVTTDGDAYCLEDTQGSSTYSYIGGQSGDSGITLGTVPSPGSGTAQMATVEPGSCSTDAGHAAS